MRQQHPAQHLRVAGAQVQRRLFQPLVKALQPRQHQKHHIGRDKADLPQHRQVQPGVKEEEPARADAVAQAVPEQHGGYPDHQPRRQDRCHHQAIKRRPHPARDRVDHDCRRRADRHRQRHHRQRDEDRVQERRPHALVGEQRLEPAPGKAAPGRDGGQAAVIERRPGHDQQRHHQVDQEQDHVEMAQERLLPGHLAISDSFTRNSRIITMTNTMHSSRKMIENAAPVCQSCASLNQV